MKLTCKWENIFMIHSFVKNLISYATHQLRIYHVSCNKFSWLHSTWTGMY